MLISGGMYAGDKCFYMEKIRLLPHQIMYNGQQNAALLKNDNHGNDDFLTHLL